MGVHTKESRRLLDYQLSDFLELKLGDKRQKFISKLKRELFKTSSSKDPNLYEFPAIGTSNVCLILPNGFRGKLKQIFLLNSDGRLKKIPVR